MTVDKSPRHPFSMRLFGVADIDKGDCSGTWTRQRGCCFGAVLAACLMTRKVVFSGMIPLRRTR